MAERHLFSISHELKRENEWDDCLLMSDISNSRLLATMRSPIHLPKAGQPFVLIRTENSSIIGGELQLLGNQNFEIG